MMMRQHREGIRIALLTPYLGSNLGDAAIQEAVILNLKKRIPGAEFCLISYCPDQTSYIHKVSAFPIGAITFSDCSLREYLPCEVVSRSTAASVRVEAIEEGDNDPWFKWKPQWTVSGMLPRFIENWLREGVHTYRAGKIVKTFSMLVVSGGGQLDEYWGGALRQPYALFKWTLLMKLLKRRAGGRCVFLSMGACVLESALAKYFVSKALKRADYKSYRDTVSMAVARSLRSSLQDSVVPDLAFSYDISEWRNSPRTGVRRCVVGVSPIAFLSDKWPDRNRQAYKRYISEMAELVKYLSHEGYEVSLFSTDTADLDALSDVQDAITASECPEGVRVGTVDTTSLPSLFAHLQRCDYVVASRLHGVILAHRMRIPVVAISYDRKVAWHMNQMGMDDYCIEFGEVNYVAIHQRLNACRAKYDCLVEELEMKNCNFEAQLAAQYDQVCGLLRW